MKGIDISEWQEGFNLQNALNSGYNFAILRAGFTGYGGDGTSKYKDSVFEDFYKKAKSLNMPIGAYWFSCANTYDKGVAEANFMYEKCLVGKKFEYPIYLDVENDKWQGSDKKGVTDAIIGFCDTLEKKGYFVGIYANLNYFNNKIDTKRLDKYSKWVACWSSSAPDFKYSAFDMWQNSSSAYIAGTKIDTDYSYRDFPTIIKNAGLNGYDKTPKEVPRKYEAGQTVLLNGYTHKSKDASESIGEYSNYPAEIIKVEKYECEYPYELRNIGWAREKYLSDYVPPKEEKPIEQPIEKPTEQPKEKELSIWQKIIQAIIDILKAFLGKED